MEGLQDLYPKGPTTNVIRTLAFYMGFVFYDLGQVLHIQDLGLSGLEIHYFAHTRLLSCAVKDESWEHLADSKITGACESFSIGRSQDKLPERVCQERGAHK